MEKKKRKKNFLSIIKLEKMIYSDVFIMRTHWMLDPSDTSFRGAS